nr:hypothetical protein [Tanacetum cinerariifolium]
MGGRGVKEKQHGSANDVVKATYHDTKTGNVFEKVSDHRMNDGMNEWNLRKASLTRGIVSTSSTSVVGRTRVIDAINATNLTTVDVSTDAPNTFGMSNDQTGIPTVSNKHVMNEVLTSYANKLSLTSLTKANLRKLDANVPNDADYNVWLPLASVHEGVGSVLRDGPWMIRGIPAPKRVVNRMEKGKGGSSRVDDEGESHKTTPSIGKKNVSTSCNGTFSLSNSLEALNVENPVIEEVETGNKNSTSCVQEEGKRSTPQVEKINSFEKQLLEEKCMLMDDDGKPLEKATVGLNDMLVIAIPKLEGSSYTKEIIRVDYEGNLLDVMTVIFLATNEIIALKILRLATHTAEGWETKGFSGRWFLKCEMEYKSVVKSNSNTLVSNVFSALEKDNGKLMDDLVDDTRKNVRKANSSNKNVVFSPETKLHYFDRDDMEFDDMEHGVEEAEQRNASSDDGLSDEGKSSMKAEDWARVKKYDYAVKRYVKPTYILVGRPHESGNLLTLALLIPGQAVLREVLDEFLCEDAHIKSNGTNWYVKPTYILVGRPHESGDDDAITFVSVSLMMASKSGPYLDGAAPRTWCLQSWRVGYPFIRIDTRKFEPLYIQLILIYNLNTPCILRTLMLDALTDVSMKIVNIFSASVAELTHVPSRTRGLRACYIFYMSKSKAHLDDIGLHVWRKEDENSQDQINGVLRSHIQRIILAMSIRKMESLDDDDDLVFFFWGKGFPRMVSLDDDDDDDLVFFNSLALEPSDYEAWCDGDHTIRIAILTTLEWVNSEYGTGQNGPLANPVRVGKGAFQVRVLLVSWSQYHLHFRALGLIHKRPPTRTKTRTKEGDMIHLYARKEPRPAVAFDRVEAADLNNPGFH